MCVCMCVCVCVYFKYCTEILCPFDKPPKISVSTWDTLVLQQGWNCLTLVPSILKRHSQNTLVKLAVIFLNG